MKSIKNLLFSAVLGIAFAGPWAGAVTVVDLNFSGADVLLPARDLTTSNATELVYGWSASSVLFNGDAAQGQKIYGGLRVTGGADVAINRFELNNNATPPRLQLTVPDGAANGYEQSRMLMLWDNADFNAPGNVFDGTANSAFSLTLIQALQESGSERGFRFVVRDGGTYYVANQLLGNFNIGSETTLTMAGDLAGLEWGAFDPNDVESMNLALADAGMGVTFSPMTFDNVTGVGFLGHLYRWQGSYMQATDFQVNLVEGPVTVVDLNFDTSGGLDAARSLDTNITGGPSEYTYNFTTNNVLFNGDSSLGQKVYGGLHSTSPGDASLNQFRMRNEAGDQYLQLILSDGAGTAGTERSRMVLIWDDADFNAFGKVFDDSTDCSFSIDVTQNLQSVNERGYRFVIREGDTYYVANQLYGEFSGGFTTNMTGATAGLEWGAFSPNAFTNMNVDNVDLNLGVTYSPMTFTNVTGVGFVADLQRSQGSYMQVADFQVKLLADVPVPEGYATWIEGYSLSGGDAALGADPDEDEVNNLSEYAFNGNPNDPNDTGTVSLGFAGGQAYLAHAMLTDTNEVEYTIEVRDSGDLVFGNWTNIGITVTSGSLNADYNIVTNFVTEADQGFFRYTIKEK